MADPRYKTHGAHEVIPAAAMRAPLGALSCPYSYRDAARCQAEGPRPDIRFRSFGPNERGASSRFSTRADHRRWYDPRGTDYWHPPKTRSQHAQQRVLAVIFALVLAAVLAHAGW